MKRITFLFAILSLIGLQASYAQSRQVTGAVTSSEDGLGIPGASIVVKGTTIGSTTDIDGNYSLSVPDGAKTLVFSFVGMTSKEVALASSDVVNVVLSPEAIDMDEVVVTALGITREKKSLGYTVQEIGGEELSEVKETNFVNSISGKVSGVHIRQSNTMGGSANILIRGTTSLTSNNQALFVVDGVPIDNSNTNSSDQTSGWGGYDYGNAAMDINPDDIESMSVLKGAAASALYGSRAANGVILITTKKGSKRKGIGVTINSGVMISTIDKNTLPKHQKEYGGGYGPFYEDPTGYFFYADIDGDGEKDLITPTSEDASWGAKFDPNLMVVQWDALDPASPNYGEKRPWVAGKHGIEDFFETGVKWTNSVSLDGGNDEGTFRMSYANMDEKGILPNSTIKKNSLNLYGDYNLTDRLKVTGNLNFVNTRGKGRYGTGYDGGNVMQSFSQWFETNVDFERLKNNYKAADGTQRSWNASYYNELHPIYFDNPYWVRYENYEEDERNRVFGYAALDYKLTDWLTFTGRASLDYYAEEQNERIAEGSVDQSYFSSFIRHFRETNVDLMLKANKTLNDVSLNGMVGANYRRNKVTSNFSHTVGGLLIPNVYTVSNSVSPVSVNENLYDSDMKSLYGSFSFGYKNFVYVDVTGRVDQASTLPSGENVYFYPSVSTSFILTELDAFKSLGFLNFAKIRLNYAEVGNDAPVYSVYNTYSQNTNWGNLGLFSVNSTLQNENLKPERTKSYEAGFETKFFNSRFGLDVSVYKTNSFDQIMPALVSKYSGYNRRYVNGGEIENKGLEVALTATPVKTKDFSWDIAVNWFANRNKVVSLYEDVENLLLTSAWDVSINATVGQPYGTIRGTDFVYTNGKKTVDENGYYLKSEKEDEILGDVNPDWNAGITNTFTYKGLALKVLLDMQKGGDIYSVSTKYGQATGVYEETAGLNDKGNPKRDRVADGGGVLFPNTVYADGTPNTTYVESYRWGRAYYYNNSPTARYVFDASYVKLREVALSYRLPSSLVNKTPFTSVTLAVVGRNLAILKKNTKHFDPESGLSAGNKQGIESGAYPTARTVGFNIKLGL